MPMKSDPARWRVVVFLVVSLVVVVLPLFVRNDYYRGQLIKVGINTIVVVGLNPITLYCMWQLSSGFVRSNIKRHLGQDIFESFGATCTPMLERLGVLLVFWLILLWMYRRKIFVRI